MKLTRQDFFSFNSSLYSNQDKGGKTYAQALLLSIAHRRRFD